MTSAVSIITGSLSAESLIESRPPSIYGLATVYDSDNNPYTVNNIVLDSNDNPVTVGFYALDSDDNPIQIFSHYPGQDGVGGISKRGRIRDNKVGEVGKLFTLATYFDMSAHTSVSIVFTDPEGDDHVIDNSRISVPNIPYNDPELGLLAADTYMQFTTLEGDFKAAGQYFVYGIYEDATPKRLIGDCAKLTIHAASCWIAPEVQVTDNCKPLTKKRHCRCEDK